MSIATINQGRTRFEDLRHRKNIRNYNPTELQELRDAFKHTYEFTKPDDCRGFQHWAGKHGIPENHCHRDSSVFLPWHRAYIYGLEKALQEFNSGVTLPYWDWTSPVSLEKGIPRAYSNPTAPDGEANPLFEGRINIPGFPARKTTRGTFKIEKLETLRRQVNNATRVRLYQAFLRDIESPHTGLHGAVGGDMVNKPYAAYDPLFWTHHAFVDYLWAQWQDDHPEALVPEHEKDLPGVNMTVGDTLDFRNRLGYDYIADEVFEEFPDLDLIAGLERFNRSDDRFQLSDFAEPIRSAILELHNVHKNLKGTLDLRVFINQPDADGDTPTEGNPHYADSLFIFGKKECLGDEGHCDLPKTGRAKFDVRPPHHMTPGKYYINVTDCLLNRGIADDSDIHITLVTIDDEGRELKEDGLKMEGLSLVVRHQETFP